MITAAERRAKIDKLRREREAKEKEREETTFKLTKSHGTKICSPERIRKIAVDQVR